MTRRRDVLLGLLGCVVAPATAIATSTAGAFALWSRELSDRELARLAVGADPRSIQGLRVYRTFDGPIASITEHTVQRQFAALMELRKQTLGELQELRSALVERSALLDAVEAELGAPASDP